MSQMVHFLIGTIASTLFYIFVIKPFIGRK